MVRTQLYLDETLHRRLKMLARQQGRTVSDLVREAVARAYHPVGAAARASTLRAIQGLWQHRSDLGNTDAFVRAMRRGTRRPRTTR